MLFVAIVFSGKQKIRRKDAGTFPFEVTVPVGADQYLLL
jgi:hypothetical protein